MSKPVIVGTKNDIAVHFHEPVSFFIVINEVEQGQCIREKSIVHTAVNQVQPLLISKSFSCNKSVSYTHLGE